jgi:hypothetical protein
MCSHDATARHGHVQQSPTIHSQGDLRYNLGSRIFCDPKPEAQGCAVLHIITETSNLFCEPDKEVVPTGRRQLSSPKRPA